METKFKLQLGVVDSLEELKTAITNGVTREFITDITRSTLRAYQKDTDMNTLIDEFNTVLASNDNHTYTDFNSWIVAQTEHVSNLMLFVTKLDAFLSSVEKTEQGQIVSEFQNKLMEFLTNFNKVKISEDVLDNTESQIKSEYIKDTLTELAVVNEAKLLCMLIGAKLDIAPVDVSKNKNTFIETKLSSLNKILTLCENSFNYDLEKVNDKILSLNEKFYALCYESLTDGEKAEKSRKIIKQLNPHRELLDKLENRLTEANEIGRQLSIHKKKLNENMDNLKIDLDNRIAENPSQKDIVQFEFDSADYLSDSYINQIDESITRLNNLKEKISAHYDVLDKLETALKSAIPTENEMKKYSSITFKLQEISVKLDMAKSQVSKDDKENLTLINTIKSGLKTMIAYAIDTKDLFMRNSLMTASYKAVNAMYDIVDGNGDLVQIKLVTDKLTNYNEVYNEFADGLVEYRKTGNNLIRDLSIVLGRQVNGVNLLEMIRILDAGIKQIDTLFDSLNINNTKQKELLESILAL